MHRRDAIRRLLALPMAPCLHRNALPTGQEGGWTPLFNGSDLQGWETFLGKPHKTVDIAGLPRNQAGEYLGPLGVDLDPRRVCSVVSLDGAPAIRISGEIYGALTTREEYRDYHLRFEVRWGEKRWPPREDQVRDTGCCYHAVAPHGASYGFWMRSCEFQIQEHDFGDFYSLAGAIVDVEATPLDPSNPKSELVYRQGAPLVGGHSKRVIKSADHERPRGEWNTMDLYCLGQRSVHVVNGQVVMRLSGIRHPAPGGTVPVSGGRLQFQSEGGEVFFRNIAIRRLPELAAAASRATCNGRCAGLSRATCHGHRATCGPTS
jgi:hypothetical protein